MALILLVEDDPDVAEMLAEVLLALEYEVRRADCASAALDLIDGGLRPDLLLSDMTMPGEMNGLELAIHLRGRLPGLPVVLATGHAERNAELTAHRIPVLSKPFRTGDLEAAVEAALQSRPQP